MSEHITLEELFAFVYDDSMGPEAMARAARVNAHLMACPACQDACRALMDLRESADGLAFRGAATDRPGVADRLLEGAAWFRLRVQDAARKLLLDAARFGECDFGHPIPVGARSAGGGCAAMDRLVDNENSCNQFAVRDGALTVRLDAEEVSSLRPTAVLLREDGSPAAIQEMVLDGQAWTAEFHGVEDGSYELAVL
ncbi:hypothetical protein [uncultured Pseudoflavonifractor sp.]|uniref:hypothetical protein n=1 Tax=uncultured Pseudoflavonifractor sp. TaxID=1221379 RepID=UPI0025F63EFD|nr:hypothetical protein [uncultured Pseudoflavonifractor sp.]